ncbi:helix-turn-helix domain-containing protein [Olsenella sp. DNF00959]|uniref:helix-turn-helix domain-containing protein n=1 Tax=Olsenella sp. DNF00959 TaxID=1476999 RepID=UPI0007823093|nr:helix-turn-helix domain-containing protein [Olsenella sp. DNF00959]KXB64288.1 hypothetical protein HMPREF1868_00097 [Olsenella sp. DNF00959]
MPREKNKHMDIEDRIGIQQGFEAGESFAAMARAIGVSTSAVSREVKANRAPLCAQAASAGIASSTDFA